MARYTLRICRDCGVMHRLDEWPEACFGQFSRQRSDLPMPAIRADGMSPTMNHADGRLYDSRSAYERAVKAHGYEIIGNEQLPPKGPKGPDKTLKQDIKTAIEKVEAGYRGP